MIMVYINSKKRLRKDTGAVCTTKPARWRLGSRLRLGTRVGKKCRLVDNIGARLGYETNIGSRKIKISSLEINCIGKILINIKETYKLIARNTSGKTQDLFPQLIQHDGG